MDFYKLYESIHKLDTEVVSEDYNGWSNRETWNAALWLGNEEGLYNEVVRMARRSMDADDLARDIEGFCKEIWPEGVTPDGDSLRNVDWVEVAEGFGEDADWDEQEEFEFESVDVEEGCGSKHGKKKMKESGCPNCSCEGTCEPDCECGCKPGIDESEQVNEAQINLSINDLNSTDAETLSQLLHLAGVAEQPGGDMGMDPMASDPDFGDAGFDSAPPMDGGMVGMDDMAALDVEPEPMDAEPVDMGMGPDMDMGPEPMDGDLEGAFDAEMSAPEVDGDGGMEIEPMDDVPVDMDADDDAVVMGDYTEESLDDLLQLAGVKKIEEDPKAWSNEPDEEALPHDVMDQPGKPFGGNKHYPAAAGGDNPMAVKERAEKLKRKLEMYK